MPRFEVPVRTALRFEPGPPSVFYSLSKPASVVIEFEGREFGWLALKPAHENDFEPAPTLTARVEQDTQEEWDAAREAAQRLLSAFAFEFDTRLVSNPSSGGSSERDLLHPYGARVVNDVAGFHFAAAPKRVVLRPEPELRLALAVYREGLNASSPFYGFLAFWNVLETTFSGNRAQRNKFLRAEAPKSHFGVPVKGDVAAKFRDDSRNAVAHIVRDDPTDTSIDPDLPGDRVRLEVETRWLRDLARKAVLQRWPKPVTLEVEHAP